MDKPWKVFLFFVFKFTCNKYIEVRVSVLFSALLIAVYSAKRWCLILFRVFAAAGVSSLSSHGIIWQRRLRPEWVLKAYRKPESSLIILLSHLLFLTRCSLSLCHSVFHSVSHFPPYSLHIFLIMVSTPLWSRLKNHWIQILD